METFHPHPAEISWRDYEIYQAFLLARQEHLAGLQSQAGGGFGNARRHFQSG